MTSENDTLTSARDLGRVCSGPALAAYLQWVRSEVQCYSIDRVLFIEPACGWLRHFTQAFPSPGELWMTGTEETFRLAELQHSMIEEGLAAVAVGFNGLNAKQVFRRFGVAAPGDHVLADLDLTEEKRFGFGQEELTHRFVRAFKWDFFRAANRTRAELFRHLVGSGLRPGMQVAVVDMGWTGGAVDSCERVIRSLLDVNVHGFSFLLKETEEQLARDARFFFKSFIGRMDLPQVKAVRLQPRLDRLALALMPPVAARDRDAEAPAISLQIEAGIADCVADLKDQGRLAGSAASLMSLFTQEDEGALDLLREPGTAPA